MQAYRPVRIGTMVLGLEVPHVHVHVAPIWKPTDLDLQNAQSNTSQEALAHEASVLRQALRELGYTEVSD